MTKRQKLIRVALAGVMLLALCGAMVAVVMPDWWPQPQVNWNAWLGTVPGWGPEPQVNWNAWLGTVPGWGPEPQVNWNS